MIDGNVTRVRTRVNGEAREWTIAAGETLLDALRRHGYFGAKRGCDDGLCGACTVLLDGRPVRGCEIFAAQAEGREIETIEGLARGGRLDPLQQTFLDRGAVQCGFCTSGMILAAKALLRQNSSPSEWQVRDTLAGHLCRCTGYCKPVEAVLAASGAAAGSSEVEGAKLVTGAPLFAADIHLLGMLCGKILLSQRVGARAVRVNAEKAREVEGVRAVLTAREAPGVFTGDRVAAVAAESAAIAEKALELIEVEYEGAPGSAEIPRRAFAPIEPAVAICWLDAGGRLVVRSSTEAPFECRRRVAKALDVPVGRVRVMQPRLGGSFGGRREMVVEDICAALALAARRPVKIELTREEEFRLGGGTAGCCNTEPVADAAECMERAAEAAGWKEKRPAGRGAGMACASGRMRGGEAGAFLKRNEDGSFVLHAGTSGGDTSLAQIAAETLGVTVDRIVEMGGDTDVVPYGSGNGIAAEGAVRKVAEKVRARLLAGEQRQIMESASHVESEGAEASCAVCAEVEVNAETGEVRVLHVAAAAEAGGVRNRTLTEGQVEGAVARGLGWALSEELELDTEGRVANGNFRDYRIFNARDMPRVTAILVDSRLARAPVEAVAEATAAAVANAVFDVTGVRVSRLPIRAEEMLSALRAKGG